MITRFSQFTAHISEIYWMIQKIEREEMERLGLKGSQAQCLVAISRRSEGVTAAELCTLCEKDKASVSRTIADLVARNLVRRVGSGAYRAALCLTEEGKKIAEIVNQKVDLAARRAGEGLSDEDRSVFYACLNRISGNLKKISQEGLTL